MNKLKQKINNIPKSFFTLNDLGKIIDLDKNSLKVFVNRAIKSGELIRLVKGYYTADINSLSWESFAINVYRPSYISFESGLNYHGILSQQTDTLTLATNKRKKELEVGETRIIYRHIKKELFWGYSGQDDFFIAEPEKAFLDLAYLSLNGYAKFDPEEMNLDLLDAKKTKRYLKNFSNRRLDNLVIGLFKE